MGSVSDKALKEPLEVQRLPLRLHSDESRVITRLFSFANKARLTSVFERISSIHEDAADRMLTGVLNGFEGRHRDLRKTFEEHYGMVANLVGSESELSPAKRLLVGSCFTMEYAIEAAALFNPSIVAHFDQKGAPWGGLRCILSLRATGEGHVSSVVFRTGTITHDGVDIDPAPRYSAATRRTTDQHYRKDLFRRKIGDLVVDMSVPDRVMAPLKDTFTFVELEHAIAQAHRWEVHPALFAETIESMIWVARCNYRIQLPEDSDVYDLLIFPQSDGESRGIEDLRLVRFTEDDGATRYFGTYTAFNGLRILPMLIETTDFKTIEIHTLNGACARDKGMALFPRRIGGHYVMCSRIDGEGLYIMYSDMVHFWESAEKLASPVFPWEVMLMGNCGSPIETEAGWLLITHGVGPMRRYCIGAMLLDLDDPLRIIGRLRTPLLEPSEHEREGYVPNVVYSCGSLLHDGRLYLPYAMADRAAGMASIDSDALINRLLDSPPL